MEAITGSAARAKRTALFDFCCDRVGLKPSTSALEALIRANCAGSPPKFHDRPKGL